jgi:hypothetical protein
MGVLEVRHGHFWMRVEWRENGMNETLNEAQVELLNVDQSQWN